MTDKTKKPAVTVKDATDADELEIALFKWRIGVCTDEDTTKDVIATIKQRGGINPEHAKRGAVLFKDTVETTDDWWTLYLVCKFGAVEDDTKARFGFDTALANGWGTGRVKEYITEANRNGHATPRTPLLAEQCADKVIECRREIDRILNGQGREQDNNISPEGWYGSFADWLAALPAVADALAKRERK